MAVFLMNDGMSSQTTLVDVSVYGTPQTVISFLRDDMKNTKILSADERLLYSVETDTETNARTRILRGDTQSIIASIERKDLRADTIKFNQQSSVKLASWLHGSNGKWTDLLSDPILRCVNPTAYSALSPCTFEMNGLKYIWKANQARQIALYPEDEYSSPIAWFQTSRKGTIDGIPAINRALLALMEPAQHILDAIVVSLLVVENALRIKEARYRNAGGAITMYRNGV